MNTRYILRIIDKATRKVEEADITDTAIEFANGADVELTALNIWEEYAEGHPDEEVDFRTVNA